jgi:Holliday junction resolvase RusA-like endonuclease
MSFWQYKHDKDNWLLYIKFATYTKTPDKPLTKAKVTITRHSSKEPDCDNLYGAMKPVLDALVKLQIILDDRPSVIDLKCKWAKCPQKNGKITIEIEEVAEE